MNRKQRWVLAIALAAFVGTLFYVPMDHYITNPYHYWQPAVLEYQFCGRPRLTLAQWEGRVLGDVWEVNNIAVATEWVILGVITGGAYFLLATRPRKESRDAAKWPDFSRETVNLR